ENSNKILMVVEELPCKGHNGYSTYNRAFLDYFLAAGKEVHICITGPRLPGLIFKPAQQLGSNKPVFHYLHAFEFGGVCFPSTRAAMLRGVNASLPIPMRAWFQNVLSLWPSRKRQAGLKAAAIGRRLDQAESVSIASLIDSSAPDWVFVDTIFRAGFIPFLRSSPTLALIAHDVFYQRCQSIAAQGIPVKPWVSAEDEGAILNYFDRVVAISDEDGTLLQALAPARTISTLMSPLDVVVTGVHPKNPGMRVLYLGSRAHHNTQGLQWFLDEIWPQVLATVPDAALDVVGSVCDGLQPRPNVTLHGRVDSIASIALNTRFAVNPVLAGSGLKIKMLDYFAHSLPCVTTGVGAIGFPRVSPSAIRICLDADSYATAVIDWLQNDDVLELARSLLPGYVSNFSRENFDHQLASLMQANSAAR
ncbi:MAG: glycosyltransferase family 4 protein, partial [Gallionella sp.]|nr:glycosyltransferase family 4 protein [Gallionella sp.]